MNNVNKMYYENYYNVNDIADANNDIKAQEELTDTKVGFRRGNIFTKLYWPYPKQIYNFNPKNDRQKLLIDIMENCFYAHELNLYLDNFPNDKNKIDLFNKYNKKVSMLVDEYNKKYEPLILQNNNNLNEIPWAWEDSPWPWEGV